MRAPRQVCDRCRRPVSACWCTNLTSIPSATRIVFLQHPRERRRAVGTCRMAHLCLPNSELHEGVRLDEHPRVAELAALGAAVLFPGGDAVDPLALPGGPPRHLIVLDGTWIEARKLLARSERLRALPRIGFTPAEPGRYRIRREPKPHCLSTIEAVVEVLGRLEGDGDRFRPLLRVFDDMVETQLRHATGAPVPYRRRNAGISPAVAVRTELAAIWDRLVLVHGEANAQPQDVERRGLAELVHLVAIRPATGERFVTVLAPRHPLSRVAPRHLELPEAAFLGGETVAAMMQRWDAFRRPDDVLGTWGRYTIELLRAEGDPATPFVDVKARTARAFGNATGGSDAAAATLGTAIPPPWTDGRAGLRIAALEAVVRGLVAS
ncbi:MAG TPA: tRNA-uridine aminocarboxypropyltransferase [Candidatus Binatia bacterium]|nr:tRNA-uridine aminocarboxypropyltransferase [Candidatus Binatia bacterium]